VQAKNKKIILRIIDRKGSIEEMLISLKMTLSKWLKCNTWSLMLA